MTTLAYVEHCLPGDTRDERLLHARRHGLVLEVASRGDLDSRALAASGVPVVALQAWRMHDLHPLHPERAVRDAGLAHVRETLALAAELGARHVIAVCGYGHGPCERPLERCLEFFAALAPDARARGVRLLIEPLSPLRAGAMTAPEDVPALLDELDAPDVFGTVLDTGHLLDAGRDPAEVLASWRHPLDELQLRGAGSAAPAPDVPLARWLALRPEPPAVVAVEHAVPLAPAELDALVARIRAALR